jgi:hypothetical protein
MSSFPNLDAILPNPNTSVLDLDASLHALDAFFPALDAFLLPQDAKLARSNASITVRHTYIITFNILFVNYQVSIFGPTASNFNLEHPDVARPHLFPPPTIPPSN